MTTVRDALLDLCRAHDLTTWFGNPGSSELSLLQDFPDDFRYMLGLQEMIPVGMADGYAQVTGRPAMVNLHTAPGMGNAQGQLYNAYVNKTPLIVTAGNQRRTMQNQYCLLTNVEPTTVPRPFVKWAAEPATASEAPAVLARAIHLATAPPMGPVFVSLPMDDMAVELTDAQNADIAAVRERTVTRADAFPSELAERICRRLQDAKSPVLIVGGDVERYAAHVAVTKLAERLHIPVWTAPLTGWSGFPEDHPLYRGMLPPGAGWISQMLGGHDLVLVIGAPVFRYYPMVPGPYLPEGAALIHLTNDPDEAARAPVGDAIVADLTSAAEALLAAAEPAQRPLPAPRAPIPDVEPAQTPLKPENLWSAVGRVAPADALWVSEAGSNEISIVNCIRPGAPKSHLSAAGGGLGYGLPAAVGAQLASPDRPVVALMGDGSMHYAITALWSAVRYQIPVTVVVASNTEYGVVKQFGLLEQSPNVPGLDLPGIDIVATAASYGVDAHDAQSADEVSELVRAGIADRQRPTLINARTKKVDDLG
ncbi:benzoylformate decarboxylase [Mycolicibacterium moriokaense]|uniref:acetolactate synthase n=1 Tax=Mycolicibacterium moriokaense TaxID=39691 RepID=A0A318HP88_9MYCO|nr:benzoylformate decarboxylase [Mycolicibacterium moriokaense]PXX10329.1 benzoylformate decarboxylase [Mycolicibacterium moriokaense]